MQLKFYNSTEYYMHSRLFYYLTLTLLSLSGVALLAFVFLYNQMSKKTTWVVLEKSTI